MHPAHERALLLSRRHFFGRTATGIGTAALASLLAEKATAKPGQRVGGLPALPHFAPKAKRAIYLFMSEGPSQMDTWDYKPKLADLFDKDLPASVIGKQRLTTMTSGQGRLPVAPSKYKFSRHGKNGTWVSELLPHTAKIVDDITLVRSMKTDSVDHEAALKDMKGRWKRPISGMKWYRQVQRDFASLPAGARPE